MGVFLRENERTHHGLGVEDFVVQGVGCDADFAEGENAVLFKNAGEEVEEGFEGGGELDLDGVFLANEFLLGVVVEDGGQGFDGGDAVDVLVEDEVHEFFHGLELEEALAEDFGGFDAGVHAEGGGEFDVEAFGLGAEVALDVFVLDAVFDDGGAADVEDGGEAAGGGGPVGVERGGGCLR